MHKSNDSGNCVFFFGGKKKRRQALRRPNCQMTCIWAQDTRRKWLAGFGKQAEKAAERQKTNKQEVTWSLLPFIN